MKQGILFFAEGRQPLPLLAVAIHSLKKHYSGHIGVCFGPDRCEWFVAQLKEDARVCVVRIDSIWKGPGRRKNKIWNTKPKVHRHSPFDVTVLYDCDHVFIREWDTSLFDLVRKQRLLSCHKETSSCHKQFRRAGKLRKVFNLTHEQYPCHTDVSGGCVGSVKSPLLEEWESNIPAISNIPNMRMSPDEHALSYVMTRHGSSVCDCKWSYVVGRDTLVAEDALALHMSCGNYRYREEFQEAMCSAQNDDYLGLRTHKNRYRQYNLCASPYLPRNKA